MDRFVKRSRMLKHLLGAFTDAAIKGERAPTLPELRKSLRANIDPLINTLINRGSMKRGNSRSLCCTKSPATA